jgi:hypothetical protein
MTLSIRHLPSRRLAAGLAAVLLVVAVTAPAAASRPYHHLVSRLDGVGAATIAYGYERVGELDRYQAASVGFGENRVNNLGEQPATTQSVCVTVDTGYLPADGSSDDYLAVHSAGGCVEGNTLVDLDARNLAYATVTPASVTLELQSCSALPGWEALCDVPAKRAATIDAQLVATSELFGDRHAVRYPATDECVTVEVGSSGWREALGAVSLDGSPLRVAPLYTFIFDGQIFFNLLCRE